FVPGFLRKLTRNVLNMDPPDHTRLRTLVNKAFTPRVVERLRPRIEELCDELIERAAGRGSMELVRDFALPLPLTVISDLLGVPANDRGEFSHWSKSMVGADSGRPRD